MIEMHYATRFASRVDEPCPYGMHYKGSKTIFKIGSGACKEACPYSLLSRLKKHPKQTVLCTADEQETVFKSVPEQ